MKEFLKNIIKKPLTWVVIIELIIVIILIKLGFKITYAPQLDNNWEAIGAVGQWAGALVGILIPIVVIYIQYSLDKNKREIGESNSDLLNEFKKYYDKIKILSELVNENGDIEIDGGKFTDEPKPDLKEKALKFINISFISNTKRIAEHLGISDEEAFFYYKKCFCMMVVFPQAEEYDLII